jgi:hypothetical protein
MKKLVICLLSVVMLVTMMLPADIAAARGWRSNSQTATNETAINQTNESPLIADFDFSVC